METKVYQGDCIDILESFSEDMVDLVYLDPPFFTQRKHKLSNRTSKKNFVFDDCWDSIGSYSKFIRKRLIHLHRVLKSTGSTASVSLVVKMCHQGNLTLTLSNLSTDSASTSTVRIVPIGIIPNSFTVSA